ncbi:MAG: hypothetical protein Kow0031_16060 [Anaerolineae bacterium]
MRTVRATIAILWAIALLSASFLALGLNIPVSQAKPLSAGTVVDADIVTHTTWTMAGSPYTLTTNITVNPSATLTIEPGVVVKGDDNVGLTVEGHLEAIGTPAQPITFTSVADTGPGEWRGIHFGPSTAGESTGNLKYVTLRYWGDFWSGIRVWNDGGLVSIENSQIISGASTFFDDRAVEVVTGRLLISGTTIAGNGDSPDDVGIDASTGVVTITNSIIRDNAGVPLRLDAARVPTMLKSGNTFSGNNPDQLIVDSGTIKEDVTFDSATGLTSYRLYTYVTVEKDVNLTIAPGITIYGQQFGRLEIYGHLDARGTSTQPITFTALPGGSQWDWSGLRFFGAGSANLDYVTISDSGGDGLYASVSSAAITVTNSLIRDNTEAGVNVWSGADVNLTNTTVSSNGESIRLPAENIVQVLNGGNTLTNNGNNRLRLSGGSIDSDLTFEPTALWPTYELDGSVTVASGVTLTVAPGMTIYADNSHLQIEGHLEARGTPTQPITFTSATDTGPGEWDGLYFYGYGARQGTGNLDYATIRHWRRYGLYIRYSDGQVNINHSQIISGADGSAYSDFGVWASDGSRVSISDTLIAGIGNDTDDYGLYIWGIGNVVTVTDSCIVNNISDGIYLNGGSNFSITGSDISGNGGAALTNTTGITASAQYNWWGHPSGPQHPDNFGGVGAVVGGNVDFDNWLADPICSSYLRLAKKAPDTAIIGQPITYTLTVFNRSSVPAANVVITDVLPVGANFSQALDGGQLVGGQVISWVLPQLAGPSSADVRFVVTATDSIVNSEYRATSGGVTAPGIYPVETTVVSQGSGEFINGQRLLKQGSSRAVTMRDLDGDGDLDAVVVNGSPNEVWLNNGDGTFGDGDTPDFTFGNNDSQAIALNDLNGDALPDIVVGNNGANTVWLNNGNGTFNLGVSGPGVGNTQAIALGDLNGDGTPDAFVAGGNGQPDQIWLNTGSGSFVQDPDQSLGNSSSQAVSLVDIDADGDVDAVVGTDDGQPNQVWLNNGSGVFSDTISLGSDNAQAVALGDIDQNGAIDVVFGMGGSQPSQVWLNNGSGVFTQQPGQPLGYANAQAIALGDFDADGDPDVFIATGSGQGNQVWLNNGSGIFNDTGQIFSVDDSTGVAVGDLDGDGDLDVFAVNQGSSPNQVLLNRNRQVVQIDPAGGQLVDVSQGLTTTITVPPGVLGQTTVFTFTEITEPTPPVSATLGATGRGFQLEAAQNAQPVSDPFNGSVTFTVHYNPGAVDAPDSLRLYYQDTAVDRWLDVASTCSPTSTYSSGSHFVAVAVCHLTEFSLFETSSGSNVFLPVILKQQ